MFSVITAPSASVPVIVNTVELLAWETELLRTITAPNKSSDVLAVLPLTKVVDILAPPADVNAISSAKAVAPVVVVTVPKESTKP